MKRSHLALLLALVMLLTGCGAQGSTVTILDEGTYILSGTLENGMIIVDSGKDGILAENDDDTDAGFVYIGNGTYHITAYGDGIDANGTLEITLKDKGGSVILSHTPALDYAVVILSSPHIITGNTYTVTAGTNTGEVTAK